jgi:hypothetical protein
MWSAENISEVKLFRFLCLIYFNHAEYFPGGIILNTIIYISLQQTSILLSI